MGYETIPLPTKRNPGRYSAGRQCEGCGALLSRNNPQSLCAPCNGGDWEPPQPAAIHPAAAARVEHERGLEQAA